MCDSEQLEARISVLEKQLIELPQKILRDAKKLMDMHTHEMGGKIVWKVPVDELKKVLEKQMVSTKPPAGKLQKDQPR